MLRISWSGLSLQSRVQIQTVSQIWEKCKAWIFSLFFDFPLEAIIGTCPLVKLWPYLCFFGAICHWYVYKTFRNRNAICPTKSAVDGVRIEESAHYIDFVFRAQRRRPNGFVNIPWSQVLEIKYIRIQGVSSMLGFKLTFLCDKKTLKVVFAP